MNVGSRVVQAGFTNTQVLVRAVLSAGVGGPAPCLGVRGSVVVLFSPASEVDRHTGPTVAEAATKAGVSVEIVSGPKPAGGFRVQPRRWVVERTNGWIDHCRQLDRQYEVTLEAHEGFLYLSQIALLLRRLDRGQLFDTL